MKKIFIIWLFLLFSNNILAQYHTVIFNKQEVFMRYTDKENRRKMRRMEVNNGNYKFTFNKEYNNKKGKYFEFINEYESWEELGYYAIVENKGIKEGNNGKLFQWYHCFSTELSNGVNISVQVDYDELCVYTKTRMYRYTYDINVSIK